MPIKEHWKEVIRGASLLSWFGVVASMVVLGLFLFKAVEQDIYLQKSMFYYAFGAFLGLCIIGFTIISALVKAGILKRDFWLIFDLFIFDPKEDSILGDTKFVKYLTFSNVFHVAMIFGLFMASISAFTQTSFTGLPGTEYQVTETGKLILGTEPATFSEELWMVFIIGLLIGLTKFLIKKYDLPPSFKILSYTFMIPIIGMLFWVAIHIARYGAEETSLLATMLFGFVGNLFSMFAGTILVRYIWHFFGNLFGKAGQIFSNEAVFPVILVILILYATIFIVYKVFKYSKLKSVAS